MCGKDKYINKLREAKWSFERARTLPSSIDKLFTELEGPGSTVNTKRASTVELDRGPSGTGK